MKGTARITMSHQPTPQQQQQSATTTSILAIAINVASANNNQQQPLQLPLSTKIVTNSYSLSTYSLSFLVVLSLP